MKRTIYFCISAIALIAFLGSAVVGEMLGRGVLHPMVRPLIPEAVRASEQVLQSVGAIPEDFAVMTPDGVPLRGWKVRTPRYSGDWVLLFHGVSDNRTGMTGQAALLLHNGYNIVMM